MQDGKKVKNWKETGNETSGSLRAAGFRVGKLETGLFCFGRMGPCVSWDDRHTLS